MTLEERVQAYFDSGPEPAGRLILDLLKEIKHLQAQLDLSARAWKNWESTLRCRDLEVAELRAELRRAKLKGVP